MPFSPLEDPTNDVSDAEVDELMEKFGDESDGPTQVELAEDEAPAPVVETATQTPVAAKPQAPAAPVANTAEQEFEYDWNGQKIKAPLSQILKKASMGHDYSQKMAEFKSQRESVTQIEAKYKPIDEWVAANPDKWEKLQSAIKQEQAGLGDIPPDHPLMRELNEVKSFVGEIKSERQAAKLRQEDDALETEIQSIREKYKDLDWASADEAGRSKMEWAVVEHANKRGFPTFKSAFFDLYHDDLLARAESRGREQLAAAKEKQAKTGLLGKPAPERLNLSAPKKNNKNYPDTADILKEINAGS